MLAKYYQLGQSEFRGVIAAAVVRAKVERALCAGRMGTRHASLDTLKLYDYVEFEDQLITEIFLHARRRRSASPRELLQRSPLRHAS